MITKITKIEKDCVYRLDWKTAHRDDVPRDEVLIVRAIEDCDLHTSNLFECVTIEASSPSIFPIGHFERFDYAACGWVKLDDYKCYNLWLDLEKKLSKFSNAEI